MTNEQLALIIELIKLRLEATTHKANEYLVLCDGKSEERQFKNISGMISTREFYVLDGYTELADYLDEQIEQLRSKNG